MYNKFFKRLFDIVLSFLGLLILSPVFFILALFVVLDDPGPVFFSQKRVGINKTFFKQKPERNISFRSNIFL